MSKTIKMIKMLLAAVMLSVTAPAAATEIAVADNDETSGVTYYLACDANDWLGTASDTDSSDVDTTEGITIYVSSSSSGYYMYAWDSDNNALTGEWPGTQFGSMSTTTVDGTTYYYTTFTDVSSVSVILSEGDGKAQTTNITGITEDTYITYNGGSAYTIGSGPTEGITVYVNSTSSSYYMYAWNDDGTLTAAWPGTQFSSMGTTTVSGTTYYYYTFTGVSSANLIFNTGNDGSQTSTVTVTEDTYFTYSGGTTYETVSTDSGDSGSGNTDDSGDTGDTDDTTEGITVYVSSSSSGYYMYAWDSDNNSLAGDWPGTQFSSMSTTTVDGTTYYYMTFTDVSSVSVILSEGDGKAQTTNISGITEDTYITYNGGSAYTIGSDQTEGITVYVNSTSSSYYMYAWNDDGTLTAAWPGTQFSSMGTTTVSGTTYYYYTFTGVSSVNLIFNTGNDGSQTSTVTVTEDTYFTYSGGTTCETVTIDSGNSGDSDSSEGITVYVSSSSSSYYMYAWDSDNNSLAGDWPGTQLSSMSTTTVDGTTYYYMTFTDVSSVSVILNEGSDKAQTTNISGITEDTYITYNGGSAYTIGSGQTDGITVYVNSTSSSYYMYAWNDDGTLTAAWPGTQFSSMGTTTVSGTTYYYYTFTGVSSVNVIFDTGNGGSQTGTITVTEDTYFTYSGGTTYTTVSAAAKSAKATTDDSAVTYDSNYAFTVASDGSLVLELSADLFGTTGGFKIYGDDGSEYSYGGSVDFNTEYTYAYGEDDATYLSTSASNSTISFVITTTSAGTSVVMKVVDGTYESTETDGTDDDDTDGDGTDGDDTDGDDTDEGNTDDDGTDDGNTDSDGTDDGTDDGNTDGDGTDDGNTDDGNTDGDSTDEGNTDEGGTDDDSTEEGDTTGISAVASDVTSSAEGSYYTLQGVRVTKPTAKGTYIHNGKKINIK